MIDRGLLGLGARLATAGGRGPVVGLVLTALAVGLGTAILLFALSFQPALNDRLGRAAWRDLSSFANDQTPAVSGVHMRIIEDRFRGEPLVRVLLAPATADAPVPPGVDRLPAPGEAFVSPALAERMAAVPSDQLAAGVGRVVGTIGKEALRSPQELVAIVGVERAVLTADGALLVDAFPTEPRIPELEPILVLLIVFAVVGALAPVIVFVGTATRLSAARREHRLAALRLVGATPRQVARLAAVEALIPSVVGAAAGVMLFLLLRPLVAGVPLDDATWFPEAMAPPLLQAVVLVALVPVVGIVTAVLTLRRIVVTPLGVQRRQTPPRPGLMRLAPLAVSVVALVLLLPLSRGSEGSEIWLVVTGIAFGGVVLGIALAGPWLTALVGEGLRRGPGGAATLLAGRRLSDDPRGSFGSIAGVVMAVFVASAFFTFVAFARAQSGSYESPLRPDHVVVDLPFGGSPPADRVIEELRGTDGVRGVLPVVSGNLVIGDTSYFTWIVGCREITRVFDIPGASCGDAAVYTVAGDAVSGTQAFVADRAADGNAPAPVPVAVEARSVAPLTTEPSGALNYIPAYIVEPSALGERSSEVAPAQLYVATDGSPDAVERVRATTAAWAPTSQLQTAEEIGSGQRMYVEFGRVVELGLVGSLVLAGCSLAVAVTTATLDRRRQFAMLRSAGMPVSRLRAVVLLQAGVPLVAVALASALLGIAVAQLILRLAAAPVIAWPDASLAVVLAVSLAAAMGVVALTLPALERMTRPESVRAE